MDLLALVTADGQLHVHRLNWQRLWWTSPDCPITALEWRPDGKQLAVGLEDGTVLLLNTEDGELQHKAQVVADSALVAISWTEATTAGAGAAAAGRRHGSEASSCAAPAAGSQLANDRARRMFGPPPPPTPSAAAGLTLGYSTCGKRSSCSQAWPPDPPRLAVLACASAAGSVVLCTSRLFRLAEVQLQSLLGCPDVQVLRVATDAALQQLTVCWRHASSAPDSALRLSVVSMRPVGCHAAQLHRLATETAHIGALLEGCQQSFQQAVQEWGKGMGESDASRAKLAALMRDYGTSGEPASELQSLLAMGAVGGALQQYITSALGEAGLKRVARAVDAAVCMVHTLLTDHLQPQLEQLAFRLGELRGLALCLPWRRVTGLQPEQVAAAEQAALQLVLQAEALRRQVVLAGSQYRAFFAWLLIVLRRMAEDASDVLVGYPLSQLECVADFLAGQYRQDVVGPLLGSTGSDDGGSSAETSLTRTAAVAAAADGSMFDVALEILGRQAVVQAADSTAGGSPRGSDTIKSPAAAAAGRGGSGRSLGQLLSTLQAACSAVFGCTSEVISPRLGLTSSVSLGPAPCAIDTTYLAGGAAAACAAAWEGQPQVLLLRGSSGGEETGGLEAAVVQLPSGESAVDLAFYREGQLALLLAPADEQAGTSSRLVLVPQERLQYVPLPSEVLADGDALRLCHVLLESGGGSSAGLPLPDDCRQRALRYAHTQAPLAVSASRGVACVLAGTQRALLFDLEEDEEEEEGEEAPDGNEDDEHTAAFDSPPR